MVGDTGIELMLCTFGMVHHSLAHGWEQHCEILVIVDAAVFVDVSFTDHLRYLLVCQRLTQLLHGRLQLLC